MRVILDLFIATSGEKRLNDGGFIPQLQALSDTANTPEEKANVLNKQFQSVFTIHDHCALQQLDYQMPVDQTNLCITENGVYELLKIIKSGKAGGPDCISGISLKTFAKPISKPLTRLFQYSISKGQLPKVWKHARVVPILYKKGSNHDPANYRPVSLTCICCKLLEHIIHSHISAQLDQLNILTDVQHGFRAKRSCETQLVCTIDDLAKSLG